MRDWMTSQYDRHPAIMGAALVALLAVSAVVGSAGACYVGPALFPATFVC